MSRDEDVAVDDAAGWLLRSGDLFSAAACRKCIERFIKRIQRRTVLRFLEQLDGAVFTLHAKEFEDAAETTLISIDATDDDIDGRHCCDCESGRCLASEHSS